MVTGMEEQEIYAEISDTYYDKKSGAAMNDWSHSVHTKENAYENNEDEYEMMM